MRQVPSPPRMKKLTSKEPQPNSAVPKHVDVVEVPLTHFFFAAGNPAKTSNFRLITEPDN
jgi:hypothetical protein